MAASAMLRGIVTVNVLRVTGLALLVGGICVGGMMYLDFVTSSQWIFPAALSIGGLVIFYVGGSNTVEESSSNELPSSTRTQDIADHIFDDEYDSYNESFDEL